MRLDSVLIRFTLLLTLSFGLGLSLAAQEEQLEDEPIVLRNASFEDIPQAGKSPKGWYDCGFSGESPVDVHPAFLTNPDTSFFGVDNPAFDGNTYVGMVVRDNETYEAISQRLIGGPLKKGKCYTFSLFLTRATDYQSISQTTKEPVNFDTPVKIRIWGGLSYCNRGEILAESSVVKKAQWLQYNFRFEPKQDHGFIVLEAYYKTPLLFPYNGNVLIDNAGKIVPVPCDGELPAEEEKQEEVLASTDPAPTKSTPTSPATPQAATRKPTQTATRPAAKTPAASRREAKLGGLSRSQLKKGSVVRVEKLYFKADSSAVSPVSEPVLLELYDFLDANPDVMIEVGGHTNGIPPHEFCDKLSTARAEAVVDYLVRKGINRNRLQAKGYGKRDPIATNRTPAGRKKNQRVEIKVLSIG